jgi:serine/threonine-protein kinase
VKDGVAEPIMKCANCAADATQIPASFAGSWDCPACGHHHAGTESAATAAYWVEDQQWFAEGRRFEKIDVLGEGSFGTVYRVYDRQLEKTVAMKIPRTEEGETIQLDSPANRRFLQEARVAAKMRHPQIVPVHDIFEEDGRLCIITDWIDGPHLAAWVFSVEPTIQQTVEMCIRICDPVSAAHRNGVLHRDIKPNNILVDSNDVPHMIDFGLSTSMGALQTGSSGTSRVGTPAFMSPEQAQGDISKVGEASDQYSLGVLLYWMLTRQIPFSGKTPEIFKKIIEHQFTAPRAHRPEIDQRLNAICLKALAKDPKDRYASVREFQEDLRRYQQDERLLADPTIDRRVAQGMLRRNFLRGTAVAGTVIATGLGTMLAWKPDLRRRVLLPSLYGHRDLKWTLIEPDALAAATPIAIRDAKPMEGQTDTELLLVPGVYRIDFQDGSYIRTIFRQVPTPEELPISSAMGIEQRHASWEVLPDGRIKLPAITPPTSLLHVPMIEHPGGSWNPEILPGIVWGTQERVTAPFLIDAKEVTYRQFQQVLPQWEGLAGIPESQLDSPIGDISFNELLAFAEAVGKRPVTAGQFILALQGNSVRPAPWSNQSAAAQVEAIRQAAPQRAWDQTESGIQGLYGRPFEWIDERPEYSGPTTTKLPGALTSTAGQMLRGAVGRSWWQPEDQAIPSDQSPVMEIEAFSADHFEKQLGFRLTLEIAPRK